MELENTEHWLLEIWYRKQKGSARVAGTLQMIARYLVEIPVVKTIPIINYPHSILYTFALKIYDRV